MITALVTTLFVICIRDTYIKIRFATKFSKLSDFTKEGLYDLYEKDCYGPTKLEEVFWLKYINKNKKTVSEIKKPLRVLKIFSLKS